MTNENDFPLYTQIIQTLRMYFDRATVEYAINHLDENKYEGSIKQNLQLIVKDLFNSCYDYSLKHSKKLN